MKRITAITLFAMANLALAGTSFAQSNGVQATIPFAFTVGSTSLPAGTYSIQPNSSHVIMLRSRDQPVATMSLVNQDDHKSATDGKLVFHRYAGQYFLSEIHCDGADMNVAIPTSKSEKRARLQQARLNTSSDILVAAR